MSYNIHPLFVHFPIAFFLLYSLLRILPFERWFSHIAWRQIRFVILLAGVLGAIAANATGEIAEHLVRPDHRLVETHSFFAATSTWIYGLLLAGELLVFLNPYLAQWFPNLQLLQVFVFVERVLANRARAIILAIAGVIAISLTGLLGGVMVHGTSADPLAPLVLTLLGI
ncbi:MAG: hypothetical protein MUD00_03310 [Candidatus Pacebacteria bacterium]|jgi:formate-dependent nitrite reductase membrane component NrfD|nr:hypothetical protein [Candidatus Paceibacterota bacterium]